MNHTQQLEEFNRLATARGVGDAEEQSWARIRYTNANANDELLCLVNSLHTENFRLREALKFYAETEMHQTSVTVIQDIDLKTDAHTGFQTIGFRKYITLDSGDIAREALDGDVT